MGAGAWLTLQIADRPIRVAPTMLMFPRSVDVRDIYWDPACNMKAELYGTGALGPPSLFTTRDAAKHKRLRKALGGNQVLIARTTEDRTRAENM